MDRWGEGVEVLLRSVTIKQVLGGFLLFSRVT